MMRILWCVYWLYIYIYIFCEVCPNLLLTLKIKLFVLLLTFKSSFDILDATNLSDTNYKYLLPFCDFFCLFIWSFVMSSMSLLWIILPRWGGLALLKEMWDDEILSEYELVHSLLEGSPDLGVPLNELTCCVKSELANSDHGSKIYQYMNLFHCYQAIEFICLFMPVLKSSSLNQPLSSHFYPFSYSSPVLKT